MLVPGAYILLPCLFQALVPYIELSSLLNQACSFNRSSLCLDSSDSAEFFSNEEFIAMLDLLVYSSLSAYLQKHHAWYIARIVISQHFNGNDGKARFEGRLCHLPPGLG